MATACNSSALADEDPELIIQLDRIATAALIAAGVILVIMFFSALQPIAKAARVASDESGLAVYSQQDPRTRAWTAYSDRMCVLIADAEAQQPDGGTLRLPGLPFEVRWGGEATSYRMRARPSTGFIQVNIHNGNTRVARRDTARKGAASGSFDALFWFRERSFDTATWRWMRHLDCPWIVANFEGEHFFNFIILLLIESVLNFTNTANTHLEGDLFFSNDTSRVVPTVLWLLSLMDLISIVTLLTEVRRESGKRCLCLGGYAEDKIVVQREVVLQGVSWFTLVRQPYARPAVECGSSTATRAREKERADAVAEWHAVLLARVHP